MVHRDLTFATLTTLKHALFVYRSRSDRTLYVSTPFLPGATKPSFMQALLGQIISAYCEALERNAQNEDQDGDTGQDVQNGSDVGHQDDDEGNGGGGNGGRGARGNDSCECSAHEDDRREGDHGGSHGHSEGGIHNDERKEKAHQEILL